MARDDEQMTTAKRAYRNAVEEGNRQEQARWANVIGDILKNRGEYVEALKWLRIDYEVSVKYLSEKHLLPTCQSLGELYLRLQHFEDALIYQKKHLELAKNAGDLVEQQRASTQLGRTYHEMFLKSEYDHSSVRNAKKYFTSAMKLAQTLKESQPSNKYNFLKEYIDAHNNIGMLEMDLDNLEEAQRILTTGLRICDEEEVIEDDDGRSRLHHNLGNVYMKLRKWDKAREHIEKDIVICNTIGHCQGEAKGYINLGELHYNVQKFEEANLCYQKALDLAKSMEDEDALVGEINQNVQTVKQAVKVMEEIKREEQNLKKLTRSMGMHRGTSGERKCLLQQYTSLDDLIEKSRMIFAWMKHREFVKMKKKVAQELCDKVKLADSFLDLGESYHKLCNFKKALKWYRKSWKTYNSIGNLEGQALAKINMGNILDSLGDWAAALDAFDEAYRIASRANLPSRQLSALENMHYSQMIRFDNLEEARRLQLLIDKLKESNTSDLESPNIPRDCCSETETETEEDDRLSNNSDLSYPPKTSKSISRASKDDLEDDIPLVSLLRSSNCSSKLKATHVAEQFISTKRTEPSSTSMPRSTSSQAAGRKRVRQVLLDDDDDNDELRSPRRGVFKSTQEVVTSNEATSKFARSSSIPTNLEESTCSFKSTSSKVAAQDTKDVTFLSTNEAAHTSHSGEASFKCTAFASGSMSHEHNIPSSNSHACDDNTCHHLIFKIEDAFVHVEPSLSKNGDRLSVHDIKVQAACLYYLRLTLDKRSRGLFPIIQRLEYDGKAVESLEAVDTVQEQLHGKRWMEVAIDAWVPKRLLKLYVDCCMELSEPPNLKLLMKLYNLEVSEDEVIVSDCELQDASVAPLLNALNLHKTIAVLNLSHNLLGNETMEKLQKVFMSSSQKYGGLVLDLHCNRFGPTALFQICECPVLFARLEVLNVSGNRLTDGCSSYLSTILHNCKALYSLNIERCSITSRTVQKVADALDSSSVLAQLCIGYNNPISGAAIVNLVDKLATLKRFSELNLNGIKLSKHVVDSICQLAKSSCLSELMLGETSIGTDQALHLTESWTDETRELMKLDLSSCGLSSAYIIRLNNKVSLISSILELNLGGNPIMQEGGKAMAELLRNPECNLKILVLSKCQIGNVGILSILQALSENCNLEELNLAENANLHENQHTTVVPEEGSNSLQNGPTSVDYSTKGPTHKTESAQPNLSSFDAGYNYNMLEVADSEDELTGKKPSVSDLDDSCTSSLGKKCLYSESRFFYELSTAIYRAKTLRVLDLSNNGLPEQAAETLYSAWSSTRSRAGLSVKHIQGQIVHLSVQGSICCGTKTCCRRV